MKKFLFIIIIIAVVISAGLFLKKQKQHVASLSTPKEYAKSISVVKAKDGTTLQEFRNFLAQVESSKSAFIASKFSATIKKIYVNENDVVKKGDLLIALDDSEIKANLNSLYKKKNALNIEMLNAKDTLQRDKKLLDIQAISAQNYDNANAIYNNKLSALQSIKENIKQVKSQLSYLNIIAPFDGRVGAKFFNEGSLIPPAKPILSINSQDQKLIFSFVETDKPILQGQRVFIDKQFIGSISKRYDDAKERLLVAEVKPIKALPYVNKSFVNIAVEIEKKNGCSIPLNAILHQKQNNYIMIYIGTKFEKKSIDILLENDTNALISECPKEFFAVGSEAKLSLLEMLGDVIIKKDVR